MPVTKCAQLFFFFVCFLFLLHTYNAQYNPVMWPWELPPPAVCTGASSSEEEFANQSYIAEPSLQSATQTPPRDPRRTPALYAPRWSHPVSKVPQCVQSVANTWVQWFPTSTRVQVELLKWRERHDKTSTITWKRIVSILLYQYAKWFIQVFNIWIVVISNNHWVVLNHL